MKIVLGGCLKELVWPSCCCWRVANVAGILQVWKRSSSSRSSRSSNSIQSGATSFIKDLAKRRRASGVCGCFSVCFGSGGEGDCCGPFIIIRLGLCFLNIRLLSTLSVLVVVLVVVVLDGSICSICQLQWRILHSSSICDSHSSRILHTQCFGYLLVEWAIGLGDNPAINQSCLAAAFPPSFPPSPNGNIDKRPESIRPKRTRA